jgi:hypothetical protein
MSETGGSPYGKNRPAPTRQAGLRR